MSCQISLRSIGCKACLLPSVCQEYWGYPQPPHFLDEYVNMGGFREDYRKITILKVFDFFLDLQADPRKEYLWGSRKIDTEGRSFPRLTDHINAAIVSP